MEEVYIGVWIVFLHSLSCSRQIPFGFTSCVNFFSQTTIEGAWFHYFAFIGELYSSRGIETPTSEPHRCDLLSSSRPDNSAMTTTSQVHQHWCIRASLHNLLQFYSWHQRYVAVICDDKANSTYDTMRVYPIIIKIMIAF